MSNGLENPLPQKLIAAPPAAALVIFWSLIG
jgi:hypothetical protein